MASVQNVMKNDTPLMDSNFEKYNLAKDYNKLYDYSVRGNEKHIKDKYAKRVYNLSLKEIYNNFFSNMVLILNETVDYVYSPNKSFNNFMEIFTKNDRLVYVGILLIVLSFIIHFVFQSS